MFRTRRNGFSEHRGKGTARPSATAAALRRAPSPIPQLQEQERVAALRHGPSKIKV